ncbi:hypothetical protein QVD17_37173 [Tagetes erecta]|uniref:Uncharacterized protein n=1 Tax=Tagetes erecta TaxID=13708 RepID=A0AAD8JXQ0_TARER|nr:hypothetical protein QVD17_37173 [Tagetes erecta]
MPNTTIKEPFVSSLGKKNKIINHFSSLSLFFVCLIILSSSLEARAPTRHQHLPLSFQTQTQTQTTQASKQHSTIITSTILLFTFQTPNPIST